MQVLKGKKNHIKNETSKPLKRKIKLADTCVAHSFLHLYLLIRKNKSNRLLMLLIQGDTGGKKKDHSH